MNAAAACSFLPFTSGATVLDSDHLQGRHEPFLCSVAQPCLPAAQYEMLRDTFPGIEIFGTRAGQLNDAMLRVGSQQLLKRDEFAQVWKQFVTRHTSQAFWSALVRRFGPQMRTLHPKLEAQMGRPLEDWHVKRRGSGERGDVALECQLVINTPVSSVTASPKGAHVGHASKLWTGLLYLREPADAAPGGDLELFSVRDHPRFDAHQVPRGQVRHESTVKYTANCFVGFVNSPHAIHAVSPRAVTPCMRRSVEIIAELARPVFEVPQMPWPWRLRYRALHRERTG